MASTHQAPAGRKTADPVSELPRLGYLLKHAQLRYGELAAASFAPLGIRPHAWAALLCLDEQGHRSQREVAALLGVDRTTMVALIDELQSKGLVERRSQADDRRKNVVSLTPAGRTMMRKGAQVADECERQFLAALDVADAGRLKLALHTVIGAAQRDDTSA